MGWKYEGVLSTLEEKRKVRSLAYYQRKKAITKLRTSAKATADISQVETELASLGY